MGRGMRGRRNRLRERDGDNCFYCFEQMVFRPKICRKASSNDATMEHLIDRKHGGTDDLENLVLACKACNNGRNYMSLAEKLASRGRKPPKEPESEKRKRQAKEFAAAMVEAAKRRMSA